MVTVMQFSGSNVQGSFLLGDATDEQLWEERHFGRLRSRMCWSNDRPLPWSAVTLSSGMLLTAVLFGRLPLIGGDNFYLPKLLSFTVTGFLAGALRLTEIEKLHWEPIDACLVIVVALGAVSSIWAINAAYAGAALGGLSACVLTYWTTRSLGAHGYGNILIKSVVFAVGIVMLASLVEVYTSLRFSVQVPGGLLGNRNRVAHLIVISAPLLVQRTLAQETSQQFGWGLWLCTLGGATVLLSRSRAAWLVTIIILFCSIVMLLVRRCRGRQGPRPSVVRLVLISLAILCGVLGSVLVPNRLQWTTRTPFRDSWVSLLEYRAGSGAGRLREHEGTVRMINSHPILGVGPGNWRVNYPRFAVEGERTVTTDVLPVRNHALGEWIGATAERGMPSMLFGLVAIMLLLTRYARVSNGLDNGNRSKSDVGLLTLIAVLALGLFEPVVSVPLLGLIIAVIVGVTAPGASNHSTLQMRGATRTLSVLTMLLAGLYFSAGRAKELAAAILYGRSDSVEAAMLAVRIAPGDFRAQLFLGQRLGEVGRCVDARAHFDFARDLFPTATSVNVIQAQYCDLSDDMRAADLPAETSSNPCFRGRVS